MKRFIILIMIPMLLLSASVFGLFYVKTQETKEMEEQEKISQLIAEEYLINVAQKEEPKVEETAPSEPIESMPSDLDYDDNYIYKNLPESNAWGYVDSVLEIPALELRQTVFSGTPQQIEHDLSCWLTVTGRSDYILGATHYCIYAHNPTNKTVRISYAQEKLKPDDYILLTQKGNVFFYRVNNVFSEWRQKCSDIYVNNMEIDSTMLYIFTCGRGEWQYKNVVIEAKLVDTYSVTDWMENKDKYITEYKNMLNPVEVVKPKEKMVLSLESKNERINVSLTTNNFQTVNNCSIGVFDEDGYLVKIDGNPFKYDGGLLTLPKLPNGKYCIGVYENHSEYLNPQEYSVEIDTKQYIKNIETVDEEAEASKEQDVLIMNIAMIVTMCSLTVVCGCLGYHIATKFKKRNS